LAGFVKPRFAVAALDAQALPSPSVTAIDDIRLKLERAKDHLDALAADVFGEDGNEDTRIRDFRLCLTDVTAIVEQFAPAL
jgi:hypothetical protein